MKNLIKHLLIFSLLILFASCNKENLVTENATANSDNLKLEKANVKSARGHGDVHYTTESGSWYQRFSFNAHDKDGEIKGVLHYFDDENNLRFKGNITCLTIDENIAVISGEIVNYRWDNDYELPAEYLYFWAKIVDNGEGRNSPPDQTSLVWAPIPFYPCDDFPVQLYDIESGNFQVRP